MPVSPILVEANGSVTDKLRDTIERCLTQSGRVILSLPFDDPHGVFFQNLVKTIGAPQTHDLHGTTVWHVKYDDTIDAKVAARSQTMRDFPMHTDAAFEEMPPKYVGMYVIQQDTAGGGLSRFIDTKTLLECLSPSCVEILTTTKFTMRVPAEFHKGTNFVEVPVMNATGDMRYRRELIVDEACSATQLQALCELETWLTCDELVQSVLLPTGTAILFDNARFLHARSEVRDKNRHLLRMRFQPGASLGAMLRRKKFYDALQCNRIEAEFTHSIDDRWSTATKGSTRKTA